MTPSQFKAWRLRLGITQAQAARDLGVTMRMVKMYERGMSLQQGLPKPVKIPRYIALACLSIELELTPE